jgi:hypothetical protein
MAASSEYVFSGHRRKLLHLHNPDGTDESTPVVKIDVSAITFNGGQVPTYVTVDWISYNVNGDPVLLHFDADTDDVLAVLPPGQGEIDFAAYGGKTDPKSTGTTGDVKLTNVSGTEYDITIAFRPKA